MKSITTIIKLHHSELDEFRKEIVKCERDKEQLLEYNWKMEAELASEHAFATSNPEMGITFASYKKNIRERQAIIAKSVKDLDKQIASLKEKIALTFGEVKKYEVLLENKLNEQKKNELALETKQLNEIAINNYMKEEADLLASST